MRSYSFSFALTFVLWSCILSFVCVSSGLPACYCIICFDRLELLEPHTGSLIRCLFSSFVLMYCVFFIFYFIRWFRFFPNVRLHAASRDPLLSAFLSAIGASCCREKKCQVRQKLSTFERPGNYRRLTELEDVEYWLLLPPRYLTVLARTHQIRPKPWIPSLPFIALSSWCGKQLIVKLLAWSWVWSQLHILYTTVRFFNNRVSIISCNYFLWNSYNVISMLHSSIKAINIL